MNKIVLMICVIFCLGFIGNIYAQETNVPSVAIPTLVELQAARDQSVKHIQQLQERILDVQVRINQLDGAIGLLQLQMAAEAEKNKEMAAEAEKNKKQ